MPDDTQVIGPTMTGPNEANLWVWLKQVASQAERVRDYDAGFEDLEHYLNLFFGEHYPQTMPTWKPPVVVNELRTLVLSEASDLSDTGFRTYIMKDPRRGTRDEQAERALRALWARQEVDLKLIEAVVWAEIMGTGFLRVSWDPDEFHGMGDVVIECLDPRCVLPDPDAKDDRSMAFRIFDTVLDLSEIRRLFPLRGKLVQPEDAYSEKDYSGDTAAGGPNPNAPGFPYYGPLTNSDAGLIGTGYPGYKRAAARVLDGVFTDDELERTIEPAKDPHGEDLYDDNGNLVMTERTEMKYPDGRRIVGSNGIILYDGPNTEPDMGLCRISLEPTMGRFWGGQGFIQQTGDLQMAANKLASAVVENAIRLNNGIVVVKGNTGIDWETFASIPGQIVQLQASGDFDIKYPPPMPPDMIQAPWQMLDMQRRILGFAPPRMGQGGKGNVSPELTETEIAQSQGVTRLRAKHLYHAVQRLSEMIVARMIQNYVIPRAIPAVEGEEFKPVIWEPVPDPSQDWSVYVDPASFQVMSRSMLRRLSLALYRMGAIDRKAVLESLGWPDWEEVSGRIDEAEKAAAAAQMQARAKNKKG